MPISLADFTIVPEELLALAIGVGNFLEAEGYAVDIEPLEFAQPSTPVFKCTRGLTTRFILIETRPDIDALLDWGQYARTFSSDTRVMVVLPESATIAMPAMRRLREAQIGIAHFSEQTLVTIVEARDLTVNLAIPRLPPGTHEHLGDAWDLLRAGNWMEGFEEACQVLNVLAAKRLASQVAAGHVTFVTQSGKEKTVTVEEIGNAPLGTLRDFYSWIAKPGKVETTVEGVISEINENRVTVAHYKRNPDKQEALRQKVARQTFLILNAVKLLV